MTVPHHVDIENILDIDDESFSDNSEFEMILMDYLFSCERKHFVFTELKRLNNKERDVLLRRFGFLDGQAHTLEDVGNYFDVTRERIRQIESKAIRRLSHPARSNKLRSFVE